MCYENALRQGSLDLYLQVKQSNVYFGGMVALLAACTVALGPLAMLKLYAIPYWINVMWLDAVTYLHHHGPSTDEKIPWYRGEVWLHRNRAPLTLFIKQLKVCTPDYDTGYASRLFGIVIAICLHNACLPYVPALP